MQYNSKMQWIGVVASINYCYYSWIEGSVARRWHYS